MNIQDWLTQLLARSAADPLDWESYSVTMETATWTALWRDIDATQAYDDGLEVGLRLLQATHQHRSQLRPTEYHARQVKLYGRILAMLDKADRWEAYLAVWETIRAHTTHCVPARGHALTVTDPSVAAFVQRADGGFGVPPLQYGMSLPTPIAVHFLARYLRRKTLIERKLTQERTARLVTARRPRGRNALPLEAIQARLAQLAQPAV
jgi:hypothetical protein